MNIIAYAYRAALYCPDCIVHALPRDVLSPAAYDMRAEDVLDQVAAYDGIDRYDEYSFDSDDFPKVAFSCEDGDTCDTCGKDL